MVGDEVEEPTVDVVVANVVVVEVVVVVDELVVVVGARVAAAGRSGVEPHAALAIAAAKAKATLALRGLSSRCRDSREMGSTDSKAGPVDVVGDRGGGEIGPGDLSLAAPAPRGRHRWRHINYPPYAPGAQRGRARPDGRLRLGWVRGHRRRPDS